MNHTRVPIWVGLLKGLQLFGCTGVKLGSLLGQSRFLELISLFDDFIDGNVILIGALRDDLDGGPIQAHDA